MRTVIITLLLSLGLMAPAAAQNPVTVQQFGGSVDTNSGNKSANTQRVVIATDQPSNSNAWLVSGTVAVSNSFLLDATLTGRLPAGSTPANGESNAVTTSRLGTYNFIFNGATWDRWTGLVTLAANQSVNVAQLSGTATSVNSGTKDAGTLRVVLATDQPQLTNKLLVTPDAIADTTTSLASVSGTTTLVLALAGKSGASAEIQAGTLVATMSFQSSFDGGVTYSTGFAVVAGVQSITSTAFTNPNARTTVDWILSEGVTHVRVNITAYTSGTAAIRLNATNVVSPVAVGALDTGLVGSAAPFFAKLLGGKASTTLPAASTAGATAALAADTGGNLMAVAPYPWTCSLDNLGATLTQCQAAPTVGSLYITSLVAYSTTGTAGTFAVRSGTGAACVTATTGVLPGGAITRTFTAPINTVQPYVWSFPLPGIKLTTLHALCAIGVVTNTTTITMSGYNAP